MTIWVIQQATGSSLRVLDQNLRIQSILRQQCSRRRLQRSRTEISQKLNPARRRATQSMNGHFGVDDAIKAFLFNTLIKGGVAKLEAKLHAIKHQTLVAVADRDGRVVESLK